MRLQLAILRGVAWLFAALPPKACMAVGRFFGFLFGRVIRYHRRDAFEALERSLPQTSKEERRGIVNRMYRNLGTNVVESLRLAGGKSDQVDEHLTVSGVEHVQEALKQEKGGLVLTAHFGNWDLLSVLTTKLGYPLTIISKDVKNEALNDFWMGMRRDFDLKIVPAHNSYRACRAALKRNGLVGFILDQNMIDKEGIFVDFFAKPACTTPGLAFMSAQSKAPVIPVFIRRVDGWQHAVEVLPPIDAPPDREEETIHAYTQRYTKIIEDEVRRHPDQWIWIHRRWRTQPRPFKRGQNDAGGSEE